MGGGVGVYTVYLGHGTGCAVQLWKRLERVWPFFVDRHVLVAYNIATFTARLVDALRLTLVRPTPTRSYLWSHISIRHTDHPDDLP